MKKDMFKDADLFWKNFRLGTELQISGTFIYNGLFALDQMEHFYFEEETFEVLYNLAVGLERLEKITVILIEHSDETIQEDFEKTLITHNHVELMTRIRKKKKLSLGKNHAKLLELLSAFYRSMRYNRYAISSAYAPDQDKTKFVAFLNEQLDMEINAALSNATPNDDRIRSFVGKSIGKIVNQLYDIIREEAARLNIYVYEIRYASKAFKIFIAKEYSFVNEKYAQKEVLIHLLNNKMDSGFEEFIKSIEPLPFDCYQTNYYVQYLLNFHKETGPKDELETIAEDEPIKKSRINKVNLIGTDVHFEEPEEWDFP